MRTREVWTATACLMVSMATAAYPSSAPVIGVVMKAGTFTIGGARVSGNATLMDGTRVEAGSGSALLMLQNGTRVLLADGAAAAVFSDRVVLEKGAGELSKASTPFRLVSGKLEVAMDPTSTARFALNPGGVLHVESVHGQATVQTANGTLLARLAANAAADFSPAADQAEAPTKITGVVKKLGSRFFIQDEASKVSFELRGNNIDSLVGHRVQVEGLLIESRSSAQTGTAAITVVRTTRLDSSNNTATRAHHIPTAIIAGVGVTAAAASAGIVLAGQEETKSVSPSSR